MGANGNGHIPTDKTRGEVSALVSFGIPQADISEYLDIDPKTLRKHYRRELNVGTTKANAAMAKRLFDAGIKEGSVPAMIFWLKTRAQWSDKTTIEHTGENGGPIQSVQLSKEDFEAMKKRVIDKADI